MNDKVYGTRVSFTDRLRDEANKAKKMFAFLLLDVFLGGFAVGIMLMVTLARPEAQTPSIGNGSEPYALIEFKWSHPNRTFVPILVYKGPDNKDARPVSKFGLGASWKTPKGSESNGWPEFDRSSGFFNTDTLFAKRALMTGFFLHSSNQLINSTLNNSSSEYYGSIWQSEPCSGEWLIGIREVTQSLSLPSKLPEVSVRVRWSGFEAKQDSETTLWRKIVPFNHSWVTDGVNAPIGQKVEGDRIIFRTYTIPASKNGEIQGHCH